MITGLLGRQGSGKTLYLSIKAYEYYRKGFKIFSNYHLKFPYEYVSFEDVEKDIKNDESKYKGGIFCVDEIGTWLDSRTSMSKKSRVVSYFITQVRKRNLVFAYTTQFSDQIDKRLRNNTDYFTQCARITPKNIHKNIIFKFTTTYVHDNINKSIAFIGDPYFKLYDTTQIISKREDEPETKPIKKKTNKK